MQIDESRRYRVHPLLRIYLNRVSTPSPGWLGVMLLSLSEAALCGLLRKQSGLFIQRAVGKVRQHEEDSENVLDSGSTQTRARANTLSITATLNPAALVAAGKRSCLLSVFSARITFALVWPRCVASRLFTPLRFHLSHIFFGPLQQHRAATRLSWAFFHIYFRRDLTPLLASLARW